MKYEENLLITQLILALFKDEVIELSNNSSTVGYYTPHGAAHFRGVEESVRRIIDFHSPFENAIGFAGPITSLEHLILRLCSWSHDVGMLKKVAEDYYEDAKKKAVVKEPYTDTLARKHHDYASSWFLVNRFNMLCNEMLEGLNGDRRGMNQDQYISYLVNCFKTHEGPDSATALQVLLGQLINREHHADLKAQFTNIAYAANIISRFHRRAENIDKAPVERYIFGKPIRTKLLAAIFRLADAMDVDRSRFIWDAYESYRFLEDFDSESRLHWMKSFIASSITINPHERTIEVQIDVPDKWTGDIGKDHEESSNAKFWELVNFIESDLEEDVLSTSRILLDHNFPVIMGVQPVIHSVPAMEFSEDLWATIETIAGASSPSTSALISASLDGLEEFCKQAQQRDAKIDKLIDIRIDSIRDQLAKRPCHEGLRKILSLVQAIRLVCLGESNEFIAARATLLGALDNPSWDDKKLFIECIRYARHTFEEQRTLIRTNVINGEFNNNLNIYGDIILYGYSDQVISLLQSALKGLTIKPAFHVLECRTKTKFTRSHRLIYHDAHRYATALRSKLGPDVEITIYGDAAIARILQKLVNRPKQPLIFFGSNSILANGAFVHSMGHLSVASVAKCALFEKRVTVAVATDGMKISRNREDVLEESERNEDEWLSPDRRVLEDLRRLDIRSRNYREDHVPPQLIDKILVLDTGKCIDLTKNKDTAEVSNQFFDAGQVLVKKLKHRMLASILSEIKPSIWENPALDSDQRIAGQLTEDGKNWELASLLISNAIDEPGIPLQLKQLGDKFRNPNLENAVDSFARYLKQQWDRQISAL